MPKFLPLLGLCLLGFTVSCSAPQQPPPEAQKPAESDYTLTATIKDIMDSAVDPSADYIWESVGTEISARGTIERRPQNDEEWKEERRRAILLVEAANLLMMPGRRVAKAGEKAENPEVELSPEQIEELIKNDRPTFVKLAKDFQATALEQLKAVEDRNIPNLMQAGGDIDAKCENCHKKYWYPNDPAYKDENAQLEDAGEKK